MSRAGGLGKAIAMVREAVRHVVAPQLGEPIAFSAAVDGVLVVAMAPHFSRVCGIINWPLTGDDILVSLWTR